MSRPQDIDNLIQQVDVLTEVGRSAEAGSLLAQGLSQSPDNYQLLGRMAQVLLDQGNWQAALEHAERAVAAAPERSWPHRVSSHIFRSRLRHHDSLRSAEEAIRLDPNDPANWHNLTVAKLNVFRLAEARADAERLRELAPAWYMSHQALALVALKEEKYVEAEAHCRKELELNPNSYHGMNNLGVALSWQKRKREAVATFHQAAKLAPAEPLAQKNLNVAAGKYLPTIGIGVGGSWFLIQGVRVLVTAFSLVNGILLTAAIIATLVGAFYLIRWTRLRRLPVEVQQYFNLLEGDRRRQQRRDVLIVIWMSAFIGIGIWWAVMYAFWNDLKYTMNQVELFLPPLVLLAAGLVAAYFHLRLKRGD